MGQVEQDAGFVIRSPNRTQVLGRLIDGNAIPAQIRDETGQEYSRITEATNSLEERGLIELLVPDDTKRGRLYGVTERGEKTWNYMIENNMVASNGRL